MYDNARLVAKRRKSAFRALRGTEYLAVDGDDMFEAYTAIADILNTDDPDVAIERYVDWKKDSGINDVADAEVMDFFRKFLRFC